MYEARSPANTSIDEGRKVLGKGAPHGLEAASWEQRLVPSIGVSGSNGILGLSPEGNARLRQALGMPTLSAVRNTPWLRHF